jgi:hypothetical protein
MSSKEPTMNSKMQEALGRVSPAVAHDSNNMLSGILGYAQLLLNDPAIEHLKPYIEEMICAGKRIADLNRILLVFNPSRSEVAQALDINIVIQKIEKYIPLILGPEFHFSTILSSGIWPILADTVRIRRALFDLALEVHDRIPNGGNFQLKTENLEIAPNGIPESPQEPKRYACIVAQIAIAALKDATDSCTIDSVSQEIPFSTAILSGFPALDEMTLAYGGFISIEHTTEREVSLQICLPALLTAN